MNHPDDQSFDESGQPVATVDFDYNAIDARLAADALKAGGDDLSKQVQAAIEVMSREQEAKDAIASGLLIALDGRRDAIACRCAALAYLSGLYESPAKAARAIGVNRSTMLRSIRRLKKEMQLTKSPS